MQLDQWSLVILAAGKGTRMGGSTPKPLVEVGSKRLIEPILEVGQALFPNRTVVVLSDATAQVAEYFPGTATFVHHPAGEPVGTAASARVGLTAVRTPYVVVCHADDSHLYTPQLLEELIRTFQAPATIGATSDHLETSYWRVFEKDTILQDFVDPSSSPQSPVFMALYAFEADWLRTRLTETSFPEGREQGLPHLLRQSDGPIHVHTFGPGVWHGVNTPEELEILRNIKY